MRTHPRASPYLILPCIVCAYGYAVNNHTGRIPATASAKRDQTDIRHPNISATGTKW
jgi:hypothetical protein